MDRPGATMLGLEGAVTDAPFEALRANRDWQTGKRLTARANKKTRMALFDIQISAPKDLSVLAMVGGDERVHEVFIESVQAMLVEMEHFAAVRERRGYARDTEAFRLTGNFAGAMFARQADFDRNAAGDLTRLIGAKAQPRVISIKTIKHFYLVYR